MATISQNPISDDRLRFDLAGLALFLDAAFPAAARPAFGDLVSVEPGHVRMQLNPGSDMVRPGGIVSGPTLMGLVDVAAYAVVLAHVGPVAMAVTNTLNITFLRACHLAPIVADAPVLKLGRRLATLDVRLWQEAEHRPVAQATVGFVLP
ncbi:uncharacterized protein (TIGR00369 family) [Novosphingobium sp. PhB165]|uniref:PaaI family thioesterase n=1 Tax=Novosphingobium sp. PhB165 TaxID=2485105 RepID=UPI00104A35B4|nr:PaaI family thioesterase [Novosphingobium sp. PhB165]TCM20443.1 uncharacterized protein (TIGR00369 family) [Novosphingobium sp. PhB165]